MNGYRIQQVQETLGQRVRFVRANEATRSLHGERNRRRSCGASWIIVDTVDQMEGLERLFVIAVGLDERLNVSGDQASQAVEGRSVSHASCSDTKSAVFGGRRSDR